MQKIDFATSKVLYGLANQTAKAYFICKQLENLDKHIIFVSDNSYQGFEQACHEFLPSNYQFIEIPETQIGKAESLYRILHHKQNLLITLSYSTLQSEFPNLETFKNRTRALHIGDYISRKELVDILDTNGYTREDYTESPGQYAIRGSVVDIFCPTNNQPTRIYFVGNRIDSIFLFDLETQTTTATANEVIILPLQIDSNPSSLLDFFKNPIFVFDMPGTDFLTDNYPNHLVISDFPSEYGINCQLSKNIAFQANISLLNQEVSRLLKNGFKVTISCLNRGELDRLTEIISDYSELKKVNFKITPLTQGFISVTQKLAIITSSEIFNRHYHTVSPKPYLHLEQAHRVRFKELVKGDYIVHQEHGIGKYLGLEIMDQDTNPTDCLIIEYKNASKLYVPIYDFKKVQKYISAGGKRPSLSTLGGTTWKELKKRVKEEVQKTAKEILKLEALRKATKAPPIVGDERIENEFADSFPYALTQGQQQAITDTLHDLDLPKPMDRVLVGDVGFGKTEVAMRAALKVALSGKQVMVLVPTTILAAQHYKTFSKRMAGFPVNIQMLCRFQTQKEQQEVISQIKSGICDIIIGTHRLMSSDIHFKDLGLVVIDEEHRFGVKQKEKIRSKSVGVHSLMLSATPIPRTLNQSLSSLRDISLIDTPPVGRTSIKTVVTAWNNTLVKDAILQELAREGQVYYVYNSVQSMESRYLFLKNMLPDVRICMAHGQMDEKELEQTLWDFNNGKYDILLASTIIESGIDITNANTLIVENAQNFGLAQLYQLRGRIGRGSVKAFCYLFHPEWLFKKPEADDNSFQELAAVRWKPKEKDPSEDAKQRLSALMEFGELGSGFRLALRDMEIRGAGDLLGIRQHGYVNEVGLNLYCDLVSAEVKKLKGDFSTTKERATINLPVSAFIPPDYLPDEIERLKYYKELISATAEKTQVILNKLSNICGPIPSEIENLVTLFDFAKRAGNIDIYHIDWLDDKLEILFSDKFQMPPNLLSELFTKFGPENLAFYKSKNGDGLTIKSLNKEPLDFTREVITFFERILLK